MARPTDRSRFTRLVEPHMGAVAGYARVLSHSLRGDPSIDGEDIAQGAFLLAWKHFKSFTPGTNLRGWLLTITRNHFINQYRTGKRFAMREELDAVADEYGDDYHLGFTPSVESISDRWWGALYRLPVEYATVIILADLEYWPYEEIGEFTSIPIGTIRSRLHRARAELRALYGRRNGANGGPRSLKDGNHSKCPKNTGNHLPRVGEMTKIPRKRHTPRSPRAKFPRKPEKLQKNCPK